MGDREDGDTVADAEDAPDGDADEAGPSEDPLPPYSDDPVVFHSEPFPALPTLPASTQRRLLVALRDGGGAWLTYDFEMDNMQNSHTKKKSLNFNYVFSLCYLGTFLNGSFAYY